MNCKNCINPLGVDDSFCGNCGAKVVNQRIKIKRIWGEFGDEFFGWDNRFIQTLWRLILRPEEIFSAYIDGIRKKYVAPLAFLAICAALAMVVFNIFANEYVDITQKIMLSEGDLFGSPKPSNIEFQEGLKAQAEASKSVTLTVLKYYNLYILALIPFFALVAMLVFGRKNNFGEHIVIVSYIQGVLALVGVVLFALSLLINPNLTLLSLLLTPILYVYSYSRYYKLNGKQILLKILKFVGLIFIPLVLIFLVGIIWGYISSKLK